jgi:DNA topoisomerase IA
VHKGGKTASKHAVERGEIVRFLVELGLGRAATPRTLIHHLDDMGYAVSEESLAFQLRYLAEKGFVDLDCFPREAGKQERVRSVKVTSAGVDLHDRRKAGDTGVRF